MRGFLFLFFLTLEIFANRALFYDNAWTLVLQQMWNQGASNWQDTLVYMPKQFFQDRISVQDMKMEH